MPVPEGYIHSSRRVELWILAESEAALECRRYLWAGRLWAAEVTAAGLADHHYSISGKFNSCNLLLFYYKKRVAWDFWFSASFLIRWIEKVSSGSLPNFVATGQYLQRCLQCRNPSPLNLHLQPLTLICTGGGWFGSYFVLPSFNGIIEEGVN